MFENLLVFIDTNTPLTFTFAFSFLLATYLEVSKGGAKVEVADLVQMINRKQALIIDVRPPKNYDQGHIDGSINIELQQLIENITVIKNKDLVPVLVCDTGMSTAAVGEKLLDAGVMIKRLKGGLNEWQSSNIPLVRGRSEHGKGKGKAKGKKSKSEKNNQQAKQISGQQSDQHLADETKKVGSSK